MELLRFTSSAGILVFLGVFGWSVGEKFDQRNIDYLITTGAILVGFLVLVAGGVFYAVAMRRYSQVEGDYMPRPQRRAAYPQQPAYHLMQPGGYPPQLPYAQPQQPMGSFTIDMQSQNQPMMDNNW